ncbi:MAG: hypothetical protein F6J97_19195 [Leptolyngbya sp. SIO4C1]|nr:hypothetical protein [Leptolyngbya sp. SIO4C1]
MNEQQRQQRQAAAAEFMRSLEQLETLLDQPAAESESQADSKPAASQPPPATPPQSPAANAAQAPQR